MSLFKWKKSGIEGRILSEEIVGSHDQGRETEIGSEKKNLKKDQPKNLERENDVQPNIDIKNSIADINIGESFKLKTKEEFEDNLKKQHQKQSEYLDKFTESQFFDSKAAKESLDDFKSQRIEEKEESLIYLRELNKIMSSQDWGIIKSYLRSGDKNLLAIDEKLREPIAKLRGMQESIDFLYQNIKELEDKINKFDNASEFIDSPEDITRKGNVQKAEKEFENSLI